MNEEQKKVLDEFGPDGTNTLQTPTTMARVGMSMPKVKAAGTFTPPAGHVKDPATGK